MSSNRLCYDKCAYDKKLKQSTSPLDYNLYTGKFELGSYKTKYHDRNWKKVN